MSSFKTKAKHKATGETHDIWCLDDYFGRHQYGYIPNIENAPALTQDQFDAQYEEVA
jgi:hypothetical protein